MEAIYEQADNARYPGGGIVVGKSREVPRDNRFFDSLSRFLGDSAGRTHSVLLTIACIPCDEEWNAARQAAYSCETHSC